MKKIIITVILFVSIVTTGKCQAFYKDDLIEIQGYLNILDSSLNIRIKNISDSALILNGREAKYFKIDENYVAELSLISTGVSLLQPGLGELMYFKRLLPKSSYSITIEKDENNILDTRLFNLLFGIQYLVVPNDFFIVDKMINKTFVEMVKEKKLRLYEFNLNLKISDKISSDCFKVIAPY
jgi:hypothetical protein